MKTSAPRAAELIGERLRSLREKNEVTQVVLAERTGLRQSHVSDLERGVILPNLVTLLRIADALPCKVSDLVSIFDTEDLSTLLPK
jgi:transcriptional regulator with XRE-family HTH domain